MSVFCHHYGASPDGGDGWHYCSRMEENSEGERDMPREWRERLRWRVKGVQDKRDVKVGAYDGVTPLGKSFHNAMIEVAQAVPLSL
jgi:hypothetical protein